jgi:hypothetical protein
MTDQEKALKTLLKADLLGGRIGIAQESALKVLRRDITNGDEWVAQLVTEVTTRTGVESTEALLRLLYLYGVGSIVEGRMN